MNEWISVDDRLPENFQSVLVCTKNMGINLWEYREDSPTEDVWIDDRLNVYSIYDVTHWMPLPEQPTPSQANTDVPFRDGMRQNMKGDKDVCPD